MVVFRSSFNTIIISVKKMVVIIKIHLLKRASVRISVCVFFSFFLVPYIPKIIRDWKEVI